MSKDRFAELRNNNQYDMSSGRQGSGYSSSSMSSHSSSRQNHQQQQYSRNQNPSSYQPSRPRTDSSPQSQYQGNGGHSGGGSSFFDETQSIKFNLDKIKANVRDLQQLHRRAMIEANTSQGEYLKQQISKLTDATSEMVQATQSKIKGLSKIPGENPRVKDNQQKQLAKKLMDVVREFQSIQQDAKRGYRQQMERQYKIARPNASPQEVSEAVENPNGHVFQQEIMSTRIGEQRRLLEDVRSRNNDILKIEQSIEELFQLFQDMQLLLDNQQVMVDSIEQHVDDTVAHLESGGDQLTSAIKHAKSARKKKWILSFICLLVLAIAGFAIYWFVVRPNQQPQQEQKK